ncbi:TPA: hypothetical protein ACGOU9_001381 [Streptococcus suis]
MPRKTIYYKIVQKLIDISRRLCQYKDLEMIEWHRMVKRIETLVLMPSKLLIWYLYL